MTRFFGGGQGNLSSLTGFKPTAKKQKTGFTLAEVLITLGIIGVVAAMTMPNLIAKHQKKVYVNRMKQTYTILANAFLLSRQDYGEPSEWDWDSTNVSQENLARVIEKYIIPYLSVSSKGRDADNTEPSYVCTLKNGTTILFQFDGYNNEGIENGPVTNITTLRILVSHRNKTSYFLASDRDYSRSEYMLNYNMSNGLQFSGYNKKYDRDYYLNDGKYACNKNIVKNRRLHCAALIFYDGWQISDDYPW